MPVLLEKDLLDLHNKVAIVTGSNAGIGYHTVQYLARRGAKVYLAARNEEKAREAIKKLQEEGIEDGSLEFLHFDLDDPRLAKKAAEEFLTKETRLDILVNNAASLVGPYKKDKDGIMNNMTINHISPFVFTQTLVPIMKKTSEEEGSDVRIVNLTSVAHTYVGQISSFTDKESLNKDYGDSFLGNMKNYGLSKLANTLHMKDLQRRFDTEGTNIICLSAHPGYVGTGGGIGLLHQLPLLGKLWSWVGTATYLLTAKEGAYTPVYAAASPEVRVDKDKYKGAYLVPFGKISSPSKSARNPQLATELFETTGDIVKDMGL